ncbi:hypothetical protein Pan181_05320 [Aeoliella mucimassa]|uniref:Uncharacterized protein n=1 Tax=Aeoliella mucimassa TaxID=2527972 RepID=A0A518AHZ4_9BACT|nr:hypothetical protein Pan181_05320 [Aeoliella mucimassa]
MDALSGFARAERMFQIAHDCYVELSRPEQELPHLMAPAQIRHYTSIPYSGNPLPTPPITHFHLRSHVFATLPLPQEILGMLTSHCSVVYVHSIRRPSLYDGVLACEKVPVYPKEQSASIELCCRTQRPIRPASTNLDFASDSLLDPCVSNTPQTCDEVKIGNTNTVPTVMRIYFWREDHSTAHSLEWGID